MLLQRTTAVSMVLFMTSMMNFVSQASTDNIAAPSKNAAGQERAAAIKQSPITIEGEKITFSDLTGEVFAQGNVVVSQAQDTILTNVMHGNTKSTEVWIDGQATLLQPGTKLTGSSTYYNYSKHQGTMKKVIGTVDREIISGENIEMSPEEMSLHNGMVTRCPAKVPDYHISADKLQIWPGEKMIAYNAKFWIKNTMIFSMAKYEVNLQKGAASSPFPRIGYNTRDGAYVWQHVEYPLNDKVSAYGDVNYYTKKGFKPVVGLIDREKSYSLDLAEGNYTDGDDHWIKKEPELTVKTKDYRLGDTPLHYTWQASYGKWSDDLKSSWHQEYGVHFSRDTLKLARDVSLDVGTNLKRIHESYDDSTQNVWGWNAKLQKKWSPKFNAWMEYTYDGNNASIFNYNEADIARELDLGVYYQIDAKDGFSVKEAYNVQSNETYYVDYTWHRNLHCWGADLTYRSYRNQSNEWKFKLSTLAW